MPRNRRQLAAAHRPGTAAGAARALGALGALALLGGCTSEAAEPRGPAASSATTAAAEPTSDAAEVAAILAVHDAYRAAVLASENGPDTSDAPFFGIASAEIAGAQIGRAAEFVRTGMHRVGAPEIGAPVIAVDGDSARLEVCFSNDPWTAVTSAGEPIVAEDGTSSSTGLAPSVLDLAKVGGQWQVSAIAPSDGATIVC